MIERNSRSSSGPASNRKEVALPPTASSRRTSGGGRTSAKIASVRAIASSSWGRGRRSRRATSGGSRQPELERESRPTSARALARRRRPAAPRIRHPRRPRRGPAHHRRPRPTPPRMKASRASSAPLRISSSSPSQASWISRVSASPLAARRTAAVATQRICSAPELAARNLRAGRRPGLAAPRRASSPGSRRFCVHRAPDQRERPLLPALDQSGALTIGHQQAGGVRADVDAGAAQQAVTLTPRRGPRQLRRGRGPRRHSARHRDQQPRERRHDQKAGGHPVAVDETCGRRQMMHCVVSDEGRRDLPAQCAAERPRLTVFIPLATPV